MSKELFAKLGRAQAAMCAVGKSGQNKHHGYSYANMEDYDRVIRPALEAEGLYVFESVVSITPDERNPNRVFLTLEMHIFDESGDSVVIRAVGEGIDQQDKAVYKATTGARKYARALAFNLVTTDDPEDDGAQRRNGGTKPPKASAPDADIDDLL